VASLFLANAATVFFHKKWQGQHITPERPATIRLGHLHPPGKANPTEISF
jgi:hypothetical protein